MKNKHIYNLTGIRAIAALWVVFHHGVLQLYSNHENAPRILFNFSEKGWLGVDLFFILSGFVMTFVHYQDFEQNLSLKKIKDYIFLRVSRIYPVHLFCILLLVGIYFISFFVMKSQFDQNNFTLSKLFYSLSLTNGLGFPNSIGWNYPSWSLSAEFLAYLYFPFIIHFITRSIKNYKMQIGFIILIVSLKIIFAIIINEGNSYFLSEAFTALRVISCFTVGTFLLKIYQQIKLNLFLADLITLTSILLIIILTQFAIPPFYLFIYEILFILLIYSLSYDAPISRALIGNKIMVYFGKISFSVYMIHSIVLIFFKQISKKFVGHEIIFLSIYVPACHIIAWPIYEIVENKSRNFLMKWYSLKQTGEKI